MIGMDFQSFLMLLILGLISSVVLHALGRYRALDGFDGFMSQWIAGWIGAWVGTPLFGHWGVQMADNYLIPALLGAFAGSFLATSIFKALGRATAEARWREASAVPASTPPQFEMKKAS